MFLFFQIRSLRIRRVFRFPLFALAFLAPAFVAAQDVPVTVNGIISVTSALPPIYNQKYVLQTTDFGFLWLDSAALQAGLIEAEAKCGVGQPPSNSNIYVTGDCNGTGNISSSGNYVLVRQFNSQCGAATKGCDGPAIKGPARLTFGLGGGWPYLGDLGNLADSTQTADPQGRTWWVETVDLTHYIWHANPAPNGPPTASATATNLSAAGRTDKTNRYGDKWQFQDTSTTSSPLTSISWDFNNPAPFAADESGAPSTEGTVTGYFPCDPNGVAKGDIRLGTNCIQSLGLTNPPVSGSYQFAEQSANANGPSANPFVSSQIAVVCAQANILGYTGATGTCAKSGGTLNVLTGGNADASGSQGNLAEASFNWSFTGANPISASSAVVPVPAGDTGFTLTITYPGGYTATASGTIVQADLVAAFSLTPNPVLINTTLTLTNQMQIAAKATLNSVDYLVNPGACAAPPPMSSNPLAASFLTVAGTASVPAPTSNGGYCMYLRYNFTSSTGAAQSQITSSDFTATNWVAHPAIFIDPLPVCGISLCPQIGTTYNLSDSESTTLMPVPHPSAQWDIVNGAGTVISSIGTSSDATAPLAWTPSSPCTSNCYLRLTVTTQSTTLAVNISNPVPTPPPPTPTPPPGSSLTVSVSGPTSGAKGTPLRFTASPSGGTPPYTYFWQCDYNPLAGWPQGSQTATCTYGTSGTHDVKAQVRDSSGLSGFSDDYIVTITGLPAPSTDLSVNGASQNPLNGRYSAPTGTALTFTSNEPNAASYSWNFGDGSSATTRTATHSFSTSGAYRVVLTVRGDEVTTTGTSSAAINLDITGPPAPSTAYTVAGATQTGTNAYTAEAGRTITFTATGANISSYAWDFGDGTSGSGASVTKSYGSAGARTVHLAVTGDGANTVGTAGVDIAMTITPPSFRAVIVPGAAHLDDGTTTWSSDVSITNGGTAALNISLAFVPFVADSMAPPSLDLTQLTYGAPIALGPGGSYSIQDVVAALNGGNNKGTVVIRYQGSALPPLVSARVAFQPKVNPGNISYGSGIPVYVADGAGGISPLGFTSVVLSRAPGGTETLSENQTLDGTVTVNLAGTGSGTVTSNPAGISCPGTCSFTFPAGSSVFLDGVADPGSTFAGITGCDNYALGRCSVSTDLNKTVTATFNGSSSSPTPTPTPTPTGTTTPTATPTPTVTPPAPAPQGDQYLIGLQSDAKNRFVVTLFNAGGSPGSFELAAADDQGVPVLILDGLDGSGNLVASRKVSNLAPYQQVYLRDRDLGLDDGKHYVLKATSTKGTLLAFGTALDRQTNDLVQITDDSQAAPAEDGIVSYWVAGVSRYDSVYGAHWRTNLRIFNRGSKPRNLYFQYFESPDGGVTEHVVHLDKYPILAGQLLGADDVVSALGTDPGNTAGILRIYYPKDDESATHPLIISSRNYDDQPTGTAGSQLDVYTSLQAGSASHNLYLTGVEDSDRYRSVIGVFAMDTGATAAPVAGRIVAVGPDGSEVGSVGFVLGGSGPRYGQISLTDPNLNFKNPGTPVSIRIDQLSGGKIGAYAFTVDKVTNASVFIQALPQN
jgi:PKD repeat protein